MAQSWEVSENREKTVHFNVFANQNSIYLGTRSCQVNREESNLFANGKDKKQKTKTKTRQKKDTFVQ